MVLVVARHGVVVINSVISLTNIDEKILENTTNRIQNALEECKNVLKLENTLIKRENFITSRNVQKVCNRIQFLFQIKLLVR